MPEPSKIDLSFIVKQDEAGRLLDLLASKTELSKIKLKSAMVKGAVWLQRGSGPRLRVRKATTLVRGGDQVACHYDEAILNREPEEPLSLWNAQEYSIWFKPPGLLSQGNEYGDHLAIVRLAQLADPLRKERYLIHRLDREAGGLMMLAHTPAAAGKLSQLFQSQAVHKTYLVQVRGKTAPAGEIRIPLDGKAAHTRFEQLLYQGDADVSELSVIIETGRTHQIRRHFESLGHPVMGDPRYGRNNKNDSGLKLLATRLAFHCPFTKQERIFDLREMFPEKVSVFRRD
jgi:tRNA pseudouridine32 synthase/23S rRNA pseudouridine746 synthase